MNSNLTPRRRAWLTVAGAATGVVLAAAIGGGLTYTLTDHHEVLVPATSEPTHVEPTTPEPTTDPEPTSDPTSTELDKSDYDTTWLGMTYVWEGMSEADKADICTAVDMFGADWAAEQVGHGFNEDAIADFFTEKCGS